MAGEEGEVVVPKRRGSIMDVVLDGGVEEQESQDHMVPPPSPDTYSSSLLLSSLELSDAQSP